jgi:putative membrane protein
MLRAVVHTLKEENQMNANRMPIPALLFVSATVLATVPAFACGTGQGTPCPCQIQAAQDEIIAIQAQANYVYTSSTNFRALGDQEFVREVLEDGATKVVLGQLAQKKSHSDDVKQFALMMTQDNSQFNEQVLARVAKLVGVEEPKGLSKKDKQLAASLEALPGPQFDEEYIRLMLKANKQDLKEFTSESHNTEDASMKTAAEFGTNIISQHLESIEQIAQIHNASAQNPNVVALNQSPVMTNK